MPIIELGGGGGSASTEDVQHGAILPSDGVHCVHAWEWDSDADRLAQTADATTDVGKIGVVWSTFGGIYWLAREISEGGVVTWERLTHRPIHSLEFESVEALFASPSLPTTHFGRVARIVSPSIHAPFWIWLADAEGNAKWEPLLRGPIHAWTVTDDAARDALPVTTADVGKVARVLTGGWWVLSEYGEGALWRRLDVQTADHIEFQSVSGLGVTVHAALEELAIRTAPGGRLHTWEFADNAARAAQDYSTEDVGKVARMLDDLSYHVIAEYGEGPSWRRLDVTQDTQVECTVSGLGAYVDDALSELATRIGASAPLLVPIVTITASGDVSAASGSYVRSTAASGITRTVQPHATRPYEIGSAITFFQAGAGQITITGGAGVTINASTTPIKTRAQGSSLVLVKVGADTWDVAGDLYL